MILMGSLVHKVMVTISELTNIINKTTTEAAIRQFSFLQLGWSTVKSLIRPHSSKHKYNYPRSF